MERKQLKNSILVLHLLIMNRGESFEVYFIMYNQAKEIICMTIDKVTCNLISGWKLYVFSNSRKLAFSLC